MAKTINLGKVGLTFEGDYDSSKNYASRTCVFYNHVSWASKKDVPAGIAPDSNDEYWQKVSERGAQGIQGERGPQGNSAFDGTGIELVNNLTQGGEASALSAEQGKILKTELTDLASIISNVNNKIERNNYNIGVYYPYQSDKKVFNSNYFLSDAIKVSKGSSIVWYYGESELFTMCLIVLDSQGNKVDDFTNNSANARTITIIGDDDHYYIQGSFLLSNITDSFLSVNGEKLWYPISNPIVDDIEDNAQEITKLDEKKVEKLMFVGNGALYVSKKLYDIIPNHKYRVYLKSVDWNYSDTPQGAFIFGVESYFGQSPDTDLVAVRTTDVLKNYYDFTAIENDYVEIGLRANVGETVYIAIEDITFASDLLSKITPLEADMKLLVESIEIVGKAATFSLKTLSLTKGKYMVAFHDKNWAKDHIGDQGALFAIEVGSKTLARCNVANPNDLQDYYEIELLDDSDVVFGVRANMGVLVSINVYNLTQESRLLKRNNYITPFDKHDGYESLFLGKSFIQADSAYTGGLSDYNSTRVSLESLLEIPYPNAKLRFKLPNYIYAKLTFGDYSFQLGNVIAWVSNGQTITIPEKVLYYRLTFGRGTTINTTIGDNLSVSQDLSVEEIREYVEKGEIAIIFENESVFSLNSIQEQYLKVCMRKYTSDYSSDRDKGFNYYATILHLTDVHGDTTRVRRALQYADFLKVDFAINTGDTVCGDTRNNATFMRDIESDFKTPIYPCMGNHDTYGTSVYDNGGSIGVNPAYRQWETILKHTLNKSETNPPTGVAYPTYYYVDNEKRKLRLVFLNLYEKGRDYTYSGAIYISSNQVNWLIDTLASTPMGYGVMIMMHQPETLIDKVDGCDKFYGVEGNYVQEKIFGMPITKIVDAFISRSLISDNYTQYVNGINGEQETISYVANFKNLAEDVEFIAYATGHEHMDKIGYVRGASNKQLMLNITCTEAGYGNNYVSAANISELPREHGSTQDAITIYVIDRDEKKIRLARLGSIITSKFEKRDYMIIPYK